ncbi:MAG: hypothetical protein F6K41_08285 [Symploca sp. SIO3E6]|nr:hypothetical protein [Caldora sp. SIO3E6]
MEPSDLKETRGRGDTETRRKGFSYMVVKNFSLGLPCGKRSVSIQPNLR